eukprot:362706-Chlamydomonas_euryale.AAC.2
MWRRRGGVEWLRAWPRARWAWRGWRPSCRCGAWEEWSDCGHGRVQGGPGAARGQAAGWEWRGQAASVGVRKCGGAVRAMQIRFSMGRRRLRAAGSDGDVVELVAVGKAWRCSAAAYLVPHGTACRGPCALHLLHGTACRGPCALHLLYGTACRGPCALHLWCMVHAALKQALPCRVAAPGSPTPHLTNHLLLLGCIVHGAQETLPSCLARGSDYAIPWVVAGVSNRQPQSVHSMNSQSPPMFGASGLERAR